MKKTILEFWKIFVGVFPVQASKIAFYKSNHKKLDLKNPCWFDERLQYLKLYKYANDSLVSKCADKYDVRDYVIKVGCGDYLNDLIYNRAFDNIEEIPWNDLPQQFVIKCTHGCHMNIICSDKSNFDEKKAKKDLKYWLKEKQWKEQAELHYRKIKPRIIIEKYIPFNNDKSTDKLPLDYKIYCYNGEPEVILVCSEREKKSRFNYYDTRWNEISDKILNSDAIGQKIDKPSCLNEMLTLSSRLARGGEFPFVRVDFYELDGKPIFGELTFTPSGCNDGDLTKEGQIYLGNFFNTK